VIAKQANLRFFDDQIEAFTRIGAIANDVAEAEDFVDFLIGDMRKHRLECFQVAMNVADYRAFHREIDLLLRKHQREFEYRGAMFSTPMPIPHFKSPEVGGQGGLQAQGLQPLGFAIAISGCTHYKRILLLVAFKLHSPDLVLRILAIETSGRFGTLAALRSEGPEVDLLHSAELPTDQRTAQSLLPTLDELLNRCGWKPRDLGLVCVTAGPGSFTGLRLGITTAKTLAYASGADLVGIETLAVIAANGESDRSRLWAILDAQRQELFVACFEQGWQTRENGLPATQILCNEKWLNQLQAGDLVAGPPLAKLRDRLPAGVEAVDSRFWTPQAATLGRLGLAAHQLGQTIDPMQLVPNYYRKSAAEEKADA